MMKTLRWAWIVVLLSGCVAGGAVTATPTPSNTPVVATQPPSTYTPTAEPTDTPTSTSTPSPTPTYYPTSTPRPPTATATATPAPMLLDTDAPLEVITPENVTRLQYMVYPVTDTRLWALDWSPGGQLAVSASGPGIYVFHDISNLHNLSPQLVEVLATIDVAFLADELHLVTADGVWNIATGELTTPFKVPDEHPGMCAFVHVAVTPDGRYSATSEESCTYVRVWDSRSGDPVASLDASIVGMLGGGGTSMSNVTFTPDGNAVVFGGNGEHNLFLWHWATDGTVEALHPLGNGSRVRDIDFSPDGTLIASTDWGGTASLWDVATRTEKTTLLEDAGRVESISFTPDGRMVAVAGWDSGSLWFFDVQSGELLYSVQAAHPLVWEVAFSPDGTLLATVGADGILRLWGVPQE